MMGSRQQCLRAATVAQASCLCCPLTGWKPVLRPARAGPTERPAGAARRTTGRTDYGPAGRFRCRLLCLSCG